MPSLRGIGENIVAGLATVAIVTAAAWIASRFDAPITLWVVVLIAVLVFAAGTVFGRFLRFGEDLFAYQADLIGEAILALREVAAGQLDISFEDFVERGILAPARYGLSVVRGEEIRLSVLELDDTEQAFRMRFESGHSLGRKDDFSLPKVSLAGHALETGDLQWTNNVDDDKRWSPHPLADEKRRYRSLACMPISVGGEPVAILNVVSSRKSAFLTSDLTYIELLGAFISLAWALQTGAGRLHRLDASDELSARERKGT